ncbi:hypothetical protein [Marinobacter sp.]|uniref:hypothetical protein n=1 Tax=Marinobacter sp. TaxID=50741 RepID=UPI003A943C08
MKRALAVMAVASLWTLGAQAASLKDGGYVGCVTEDYLDQFISAAVGSDTKGMEFLMSGYKCVPLSSKFEISVLDTGFTVSQVRVYAGGGAVELWTVNEAIQR